MRKRKRNRLSNCVSASADTRAKYKTILRMQGSPPRIKIPALGRGATEQGWVKWDNQPALTPSQALLSLYGANGPPALWRVRRSKPMPVAAHSVAALRMLPAALMSQSPQNKSPGTVAAMHPAVAL